MRAQDRELARALIQGILTSGKASTMRSIYERIAPAKDGQIRSVMSPGTETGRFSHKKTFLEASTNLANLPKKTAMLDPLYNVRQCIIAEPGRLLWKADYSQAEARWCAYMAQDPVAIRQYEEGIDRYKLFVSYLKYGDERHTEGVTKAERQSIGKVGILSGQYGATWRTHLSNVNGDTELHGIAIDAATAKRMEALFSRLYPRTARWWVEIGQEGFSRGYLVNPFGRRRDFFGRTDSAGAQEMVQREMIAVRREMIAYGPQSANADALNSALANLFERHDPDLLRVLLQVHDEILGDCKPEDRERVRAVVAETMEFSTEINGRTLMIPTEISFGLNWGEME